MSTGICMRIHFYGSTCVCTHVEWLYVGAHSWTGGAVRTGLPAPPGTPITRDGNVNASDDVDPNRAWPSHIANLNDAKIATISGCDGYSFPDKNIRKGYQKPKNI